MTKMYPQLIQYIQKILPEIDKIELERKQQLAVIQSFIREKLSTNQIPELIFICTHNSRRSHFGQIWAQTFAYYFGVTPFQAYSGGTQATSFNINAIRTVEQAGFHIIQLNEGGNPLYRIRFQDRHHGITAFSKIYTHPANPQRAFCAVMTCTDADEKCPYIPGAQLRVAIPYEDPKIYDKTPLQNEAYEARCHQIAVELAWIFKGLKK